MNFFPGIYETKRTKKATSFSNPLTGAFYSNKEFLKNCRNVPRSISELDHIKQIKFQTNNEQNMVKDRKHYHKKNSFNKQESKRMQREIVAIHATARMAEPINKSIHESSILGGTFRKVFDSQTLSQTERTGLNKTFTSGRSQRASKQLSQQQKLISHTSNSHSQVSTQFNDIEILLLDLLDQKQDFRTKIIRINLQKYFRSFFKKQLSGHFTLQFLNKVQQYIDQLLLNERLDEPVDQQQYPIQLFTISSRMSFMNKLLEFQAKKTTMNQANVRAMIKFYCIPSKQFRESCLRDILLMLSLEVFEKFNCSRHEEYVLLDQFGNVIQQIMQIKFSTKKLFLTSKKNATKNFNNYLLLLDQFYRQGKKLTFTQNMKLNFRKRLTQGNFDEAHFNYSQNYEMEKLKRYVQMQNAQQILKKRTQIHRVNKFTQKQLPSSTEFIRQQSNQKIPISNETIQIQSNQPQKGSPSKPQIQELFWKQSNKRISPEVRNSPSPNRNSQSPTKNNSPLRNRSSMKKQDKISKEKLQQFLNNDKKKSLDAQMQKSFRDDFRDLVSKNDIFNFHFNHHFKNRILKDVLKKYFVYFQDKSDLQMNKIFKAIKSMNVQVDNEIFNMELSMRDYQIHAQNTQVDNDFNQNQKSTYLNNSLSWEEFKNLRTIVACSEPKEIIMNFIAKYLNFNQFGQLSKDELFDQIQFILGDKCDQSAAEVIAEVIWSWFQSNSIIENGFIRRMTLESWYEKYKIVYFMLVSLIFGTNHKTVLDLAYQVLV